MNIHLDLKDKLPYGKYKGQAIETLLKDNPGYLVWLRHERKAQNADTTFFSADVSRLLDNEIGKSAKLQRDYKPWNTPIVEPVLAQPVAAAVIEQREAAYDGYGTF